MLAAMRAFVRSKFSILFLALIALAVALTGSIDLFGVLGSGGFVRVGERTVTARDVSRALDNQIDRIREEQQEILTRADATERGLTARIVEELAQRAAVLAFADAAGVSGGPKAVADLIASAPVFQSGLGGVDQAAIAQFANDRRMTVEEFKADINDSITFDYLTNAAVSGLQPPKVLSTPLFRFLSEQRVVTYARLSQAAAPKAPDPTDADLQSFYQERAAMFAEPERRAVSVITYSAEDFVDAVAVSGEDVAREFERRKRELTDPGERVIDQILATERAPLQRIVDALKQGRSLEEATATETSVGVETVTTRKGELGGTAFETAVFAAPEGDAVGPFQVESVWVAGVVRKVTPGAEPTLAEVEEQLRSDIARREARKLFDETSETFYDLVSGGASLEEIAGEIGAPVLSYSAIDRSGAFGDGRRAGVPGAHPEALDALFQLSTGQYTDIVEADGERLVFRLDGVTPARTPGFEEVQERLTPIWQAMKMAEAARAIADGVAANVNAGQSLEAAAAAAKLVYRAPAVPVSRNEPGEFDRAIIDAVFAAKPGVAVVADGRDGAPWVAVVQSVTTPAETGAPELAQQVDQFINQSLSKDVFASFIATAAQSRKVTRNQKAIDDYLAALASPAS